MVRWRTRAAPAMPVVLDSSCWLEHFAGTERAALFEPVLEHTAALLVPVITIYEVMKKLKRDLGDEVASR